MATLPTTDLEILYPHETERETNHVLQRTDNNVWKSGLKNETLIERKTITLSFRVLRASNTFKTFLTFIHDNFDQNVILSKTGTDFFGNGSSSNTVKILGYEKPVRELANWYRIDVRFLLVS